jgi:hypothetical protein
MRPVRPSRGPRARAPGGPRALNLPRPARVRLSEDAPVEVNGEAVESLRESWLVEDRWWTRRPLRRRYWEVVTTRGRNVVVFRDLTLPGGRIASGGWFVQGS